MEKKELPTEVKKEDLIKAVKNARIPIYAAMDLGYRAAVSAGLIKVKEEKKEED